MWPGDPWAPRSRVLRILRPEVPETLSENGNRDSWLVAACGFNGPLSLRAGPIGHSGNPPPSGASRPHRP